jgi:hypothetical protein
MRGPDNYVGVFTSEKVAYKDAFRRYGANYVNSCRFTRASSKR